jgi:hypothetical protein
MAIPDATSPARNNTKDPLLDAVVSDRANPTLGHADRLEGSADGLSLVASPSGKGALEISEQLSSYALKSFQRYGRVYITRCTRLGYH